MNSVDAYARGGAVAVEVTAISVLLLGGICVFAGAIGRARSGGTRAGFDAGRQWFGRVILLSLELLVAADIIRTVALEPTRESLLVLAGLVLIRTFLSFSLEVEIEGRWPWQRTAATRAPTH